MKIKLNRSLSGPNGSFSAGQSVDWPDVADARRLVNAGFAVAEEAWPPEPTADEPSEESDEQTSDEPKGDEPEAAKTEKKKKPAK